MRDVSYTARAGLYAPESALVWLHLITIEHDDLATPIRLTDNLVDVTSRGHLYSAFPVRVLLPPDVSGELPSIDLVVDAIDRSIIIAVRSIATPPTVSIEVVLESSPNTVEAGPFTFDATSVEYNATEVRFHLEIERLLSEPYPVGLFTPSMFPMLFQAVAA